MSRSSLAALFLFSFPAMALAQAEDAAAEKQDPQAEYNEIMKGFQEAVNKWREDAMAKMREARESGKPRPAISMVPPIEPFIERAQALAMDYAGEDAAIQFHGFVCKYAGRDRAAIKKAVLTLTMDHAESPAIGEVLPYLEGAARAARPEVMDLFAEVIEANPKAECKAAALIARGSLRLQTARTAASREEAQKDLERVATVTQDEDLLAEAEDALFEIRHLQVGCEAPEIVAKDTDGVEFKLSDYRGKVVLLDFWGFW